jgi:opacity protein-like surface antigen
MKRLHTIAMSLAICLHANAQETAMLSLSANLTIPTRAFKEAVDNPIGGAGVGLGTNLLLNPKGRKGYSPVFFGVDFSYVTFGRDKQESTASSPPYKTSFNHYSISGMSRVFLTDKTEGFTPFIDGMLGLKIFNTRTKVDKDLLDIVLNDDQPEVIHTTNDSGLGYGAGIGFYTRRLKSEGEGSASFIFRALYLWGDKTSYVKRGSLVVDNGYISYETGYTKTNMILFQLGINIF